MKSPIITRKTSEAHKRKALADQKTGHDAHVRALLDAARIERDRARDDWQHKAAPILRRMVDVTASRRERGDFVLHFALDRLMLEQAAMPNDPYIWRHIGEMIGRHVERELATMNFAGLHKMAADFDQRYRRATYQLPRVDFPL